MQPSGILETVLYAPDLDSMESFYRDVLGLSLVAREGDRHVFFRCGNGMLLIFNPSETVKQPAKGRLPVPPHGATGRGHVCFKAKPEQIDAWVRRLGEARVEIEADFEWPQGGRSIYLRDPAGNSVEFAEPRIWGIGA